MTVDDVQSETTLRPTETSDLPGLQVAVTLLDGAVVSGTVTRVDDGAKTLSVKPMTGDEQIIPLSVIRRLVHERSATSTHAAPSGKQTPRASSPPRQKYTLKYHDGHQSSDAIIGSLMEKRGLYLFQELHGKLYEAFVPNEVIDDVHIESIVPPQRASPPQSSTTQQEGTVTAQPQDSPLRTVTTAQELKSHASQQSTFVARPLGQILVDAGLVAKKELEEGIAKLSRSPGKHLGDVLVEAGNLTNAELHEALARQFNLAFVDLKKFKIDPAVLTLVPAALVRKYNFIPIMLHEDHLFIAVDDPHDMEAINVLRFLIGRNIEIAVATQEDIISAINTYYGANEDEEAFEELESLDRDDNQQQKEDAETEKLSNEKPIVRMVQYIISEAIRRRASDIHIHPMQGQVNLVFRIDGAMVKVRSFRKAILAAVVSRIKIVARMDIAERRLPQDGQARVVFKGKIVDLRVSVMPTVEGESVVIRILDTDVGIRSISQLGLTPLDTQVLSGLLHKSYGLFLVTGPTGSGKSTTLYAALNEVMKQNVNIITVEDPVEYHIDDIEQVQVKKEVGYTFAEALRHILRHDPDAIMIGEIRDEVTAKIAVESALTGHLVLSTLHTNSAAGTIVRLLEMGVESYLISSTLLGVLAQRLIRRNCEHCIGVENVDPGIRRALHVVDDEVFFRGKGCEHCNGTGYKGRMVAYELLLVDDAVRESIRPGATASSVQKPSIAAGMVPLTDNALVSARAKLTSLAEVFRVQLS